VLNEASFEEYKKEKEVSIEIEYSDIRFIDYECKAFNVSILEKFFENKTIYKIKADEESMGKFLEKVQRVIITL
jgi:putative IMPACT (imprinted ancient) family translation regulator